jgi:diaminopimelate decarboxylase
MVAGDSAEITTDRERMSDVIGRFRVPPRLLAKSFGRGA